MERVITIRLDKLIDTRDFLELGRVESALMFYQTYKDDRRPLIKGVRRTGNVLWQMPVVQKENGRYMIYDGHHKVAVARKLGLHKMQVLCHYD
jgi:hypothetical protein